MSLTSVTVKLTNKVVETCAIGLLNYGRIPMLETQTRFSRCNVQHMSQGLQPRFPSEIGTIQVHQSSRTRFWIAFILVFVQNIQINIPSHVLWKQMTFLVQSHQLSVLFFSTAGEIKEAVSKEMQYRQGTVMVLYFLSLSPSVLYCS